MQQFFGYKIEKARAKGQRMQLHCKISQSVWNLNKHDHVASVDLYLYLELTISEVIYNYSENPQFIIMDNTKSTRSTKILVMLIYIITGNKFKNQFLIIKYVNFYSILLQDALISNVDV